MKRPIIAVILYILILAGNALFSLFGHINRPKTAETAETYQYEYSRYEPDPKLPDTEYESDFINKINCADYFAENTPVKYEDTDEYLVSHNAFETSDGTTTIVDITSTDYKNGIYSGKMTCYMGSGTGGVITPCAYNSDTRKALSYTYDDHFSLLLDDYNNDGNPDYTLRTGKLESNGGFYYIEYSQNEGYPCHHTNFLTPKTNSDSAVFIYGTFEDSIRLDHTDMNHFFFLTLDENNEPVPYLYSSKFSRGDVNTFSVGERLYSGFYENGILTLKATDCKKDMKMYEDEVTVTVRKYDDRIWTKCYEFTAVFTDTYKMFCTYEHEAAFEKGLYQLEFDTPDGIAYAEFTVRT